MEALTDVLTITLTDRDKRALRAYATREGLPMRKVVRDLIRRAVGPSTAGDHPVSTEEASRAASATR